MMAWARLDDGWHDHRKTAAAGLEAAGLWVMCLTWAHRERRKSAHPGVVPSSVIERFAGRKATRLSEKLHEVGLFDAQTEHGWPIHDFQDYLPRYDPDKAAESGRLGGEAKAKSKQTASKPLANRQQTAKQTASRVDAAASARRNPEPVKEPPQSLPSGALSSGAAAPQINPGTLVAAWVEAMTSSGTKPSSGMKGQVGRLARELLEAGNSPERVLAATQQAGRKGYATIDRELAAMNGRTVVVDSGCDPKTGRLWEN